jgi:hypothetical protein
MADITSKIDLDNVLASIGNPVLAPAQYTLLAYLSELVNNGITASDLFTALNSTNLNLSKADLDTIVTNTVPILTALNSTNINLSKTDLDSINTQEIANLIIQNDILASNGLPVASPVQYTLLDRLKTLDNDIQITNNAFFITGYANLRQSNNTPYLANQAISMSVGVTSNKFVFGSINANKIIQIDEIDFASNNSTSVSMFAPILYLSSTSLPVTDGVIPTIFEAILFSGLVFNAPALSKIPGQTNNSWINSPNINNLNMKIQLDVNGYLYWYLSTSVGWTPQSQETISITLKGRYL